MPNPKDPVKLQEYREKLSRIAKEKGYGKWMLGKKASDVTKLKQSLTLSAVYNTPEMKKKCSENAKKCGAGKWMKGRKDTPFLQGHKVQAVARKGKTYVEIYGPLRATEEILKRKAGNAKRWKGVLRKIDVRPKQSNHPEYIQWRTQVFQRDNYQCQHCDAHGYVEAHHIKSWANFPKLRYIVSNGITLCKKCHKKANAATRKIERNLKKVL